MKLIWVSVRIELDGGLWSAHCDKLGLSGVGLSEREAKANLLTAVVVFCQALERWHILTERLREKGIIFEAVFNSECDGKPLTPVIVEMEK